MKYAIMKRKGEYQPKFYMGPNEATQSMAGMARNVDAALLIEGGVDTSLGIDRAIQVQQLIIGAARQANKEGTLDVKALEAKIAEL